jgi:hypothetical protein
LLSKQPGREDCTTKQQQLQSVGSHRGIHFGSFVRAVGLLRSQKRFLSREKLISSLFSVYGLD